jgi:hypothetical protein
LKENVAISQRRIGAFNMPKGVHSSPRKKKRKEPTAPSLKSALEAVRRLSKLDPGPDDFKHYQEEAGAEKGHRGAAILRATDVENALRKSIRRWLNLGPKMRDELFGSNGPGGTFTNKIIIAHALGIFGDKTRQNLDIIRTIRNAFAHAAHPIRFDDPDIATLCEYLEVPDPIRFGDVKGPLSPDPESSSAAREKYRMTCENTAQNLLVHNFTGPMRISHEALKVGLRYDNYEVLARENPLP